MIVKLAVKPITDQGIGVRTKGHTITDQGTLCTDQGTVDYLRKTAPTSHKLTKGRN